ncbi:hypothetical protein ACONUD_14620 [Microbulbifer harenosus]|uniref:Uncharacterized protein n=1 Tax=Microbulbifer harenosus TaxID=2576840 RepID=A0ABY2URG0_9GAMM|nr:hypothetical protein [Microbulbifer harenosus]TLM79130.1 hypothetical protein FDY93_03210 [Microbulbifer harenosus]
MTEDTKGNRKINKALHYMVQLAFIEIRSATSLNAANKFADVFHNIPMMLLNSSSALEDQVILDKLIQRAKSNGMDDYVKKLSVVALEATDHPEA